MHSTITPRTEKTVRRTSSWAIWTLQILVAAAFLFAGGAKLAGTSPEMIQLFDKLGAGQWFRYLTGGLEVIARSRLVGAKEHCIWCVSIVLRNAGRCSYAPIGYWRLARSGSGFACRHGISSVLRLRR